MDDLFRATDLILAVSALIGAMAAVYAVMHFARYNARAKENLELIRDREFHAQYDRLRAELEARIAKLNFELTDTRKEFENVNHLIIDAQRASSNPLELKSDNDFLKSLNVTSNEVDPNLVFVLTPFHPREKLTYSAIVEAFNGFNVKVRRGDEEHSGAILSHIVRQIAHARLIIANISSRNPNVMYELGIAHALGKPVIIVSSSKDEDLPFDLAHSRVLFYQSRDDLVEKLRQEVVKRFFSASDS